MIFVKYARQRICGMISAKLKEIATKIDSHIVDEDNRVEFTMLKKDIDHILFELKECTLNFAKSA